MRVSKQTKGHAVIGLGTSMASGDVWQIEKVGNTVTLKDCHLQGQTAPDCTETNNLTEIAQEATADSFSITFSRPLTSPDTTNDRSLTANSVNTFIYQFTDSDTIE